MIVQDLNEEQVIALVLGIYLIGFVLAYIWKRGITRSLIKANVEYNESYDQLDPISQLKSRRMSPSVYDWPEFFETLGAAILSWGYVLATIVKYIVDSIGRHRPANWM